MFLFRIRDAHGKLQEPRARTRDDDALDAPLCAQRHKEDRKECVVRDAHAALQFIVVGRLEDGDVQIRRRHDRQRAGHDADIARKARQLGCVKVPDRADERRRGKDLPQNDRRERAEQRDGHEVVGRFLAALAVGSKFLRQNRHRRDAQRVAHRRKEIERRVIRRGVEVRVDAGAEDIGLHHFAHHAEELGKQRQQKDEADCARRADARFILLFRIVLRVLHGMFPRFLHDRADHFLVRVELARKLGHMRFDALHLLLARFEHTPGLGQEELRREVLLRAQLVEPHGV